MKVCLIICVSNTIFTDKPLTVIFKDKTLYKKLTVDSEPIDQRGLLVVMLVTAGHDVVERVEVAALQQLARGDEQRCDPRHVPHFHVDDAAHRQVLLLRTY